MNRSRVTRAFAVWGVVVLSLLLVGQAFADTADVTASSTGQGWFWKSRPNIQAPTTSIPGTGIGVGGDVYSYPLPGANTSLAMGTFPTDHLYVGWDPAAGKPEMVSGINFDLSSIPPGSKITRFALTLLEHPNGERHNGSNRAEALKQGIIACPWPDFFAGSHAAPMDQAPESERKCEEKVTGQPATAAEGGEVAPNKQIFKWTFDLTPMAAEWAGEVNPSISIEPGRDVKSGSLWVTSFHSGTYKEKEGPEADAKVVPKPGVMATVEFTPPDEDTSGDFSLDESFGSEGEVGSFGDTGGLVGELGPQAPPPVGTDTTGLAAGAFGEGQPASFWDIPLLVWFGGLLLVLFVGGSGWALQAEAVAGRAPGAASALMEGRPQRS